MKDGLTVALGVLIGVPLVMVIAFSLASLLSCGGVACRMSDATYHHIGMPLATLFCFIGGCALAACLMFTLTSHDRH